MSEVPAALFQTAHTSRARTASRAPLPASVVEKSFRCATFPPLQPLLLQKSGRKLLL